MALTFLFPKTLSRPEQVKVSDVGEEVTLDIGGTEFHFSPATAFKIGAWLRLHAKNAKRRAGDTSFRAMAVGILSDAADGCRE